MRTGSALPCPGADPEPRSGLTSSGLQSRDPWHRDTRGQRPQQGVLPSGLPSLSSGSLPPTSQDPRETHIPPLPLMPRGLRLEAGQGRGKSPDDRSILSRLVHLSQPLSCPDGGKHVPWCPGQPHGPSRPPHIPPLPYLGVAERRRPVVAQQLAVLGGCRHAGGGRVDAPSYGGQEKSQ